MASFTKALATSGKHICSPSTPPPKNNTHKDRADPDFAVHSARTNNTATPDLTTCRDMYASTTSTRTETTLNCASFWRSGPRAATEADDAERVANTSATGRHKPRPGHRLNANLHADLFISCTDIRY
jgi:hypothetical protein